MAVARCAKERPSPCRSGSASNLVTTAGLRGGPIAMVKPNVYFIAVARISKTILPPHCSVDFSALHESFMLLIAVVPFGDTFTR